ncbi:MAG: hypothetical protein GTO45_15000 [Candidatus Aminicenantes bacterium]|nr:hypothetical protein [Candidatus Aminicenantes bacterium]NIM80072.1 hypothetical protein [Candidatus Aminicenantes bacterium]NIN19415.1 hypothetical protein [Candidatus Aminicenantes bacterium]NIN43314.1 hypothetical protein [Candidatus Aminicenantes bacterium]NIN86058.1 hypothetical protein [Candidatus Aminicenantes bacterium]
MEIKKIKLDDLREVDKYMLSFPIRPGFYGELREKFAGLPFIIVNKENEIIFGIDYYHYLKTKNVVQVDVVRMDIPVKDALILNYNLKEKLTGLNLYEKLVFIKKITPLVEAVEIYRKTGLDITNINQELLGKLDVLLGDKFRDVLMDGAVTLRSALKLCDFQPEDREVLVDLFSNVSFTASHQQKILEMVEEVIFRDKCSLEEIFEKLEISKYMEMEKPQKAIIDVLFTYRYPVYSEAEKQWQEEVKGLDLPDNIKVTHYPFFEKKGLEVTIHVPDTTELKKMIEKIK